MLAVDARAASALEQLREILLERVARDQIAGASHEVGFVVCDLLLAQIQRKRDILVAGTGDEEQLNTLKFLIIGFRFPLRYLICDGNREGFFFEISPFHGSGETARCPAFRGNILSRIARSFPSYPLGGMSASFASQVVG